LLLIFGKSLFIQQAFPQENKIITFLLLFRWIVLSFTWYLSAGLKWGGEAIAAYSLYFHLSAWGISAFITMAAVALEYVEGDPLSGPCSLGLQRSPELQYFM
jgi:hypothetical protein